MLSILKYEDYNAHCKMMMTTFNINVKKKLLKDHFVSYKLKTEVFI